MKKNGHVGDCGKRLSGGKRGLGRGGRNSCKMLKNYMWMNSLYYSFHISRYAVSRALKRLEDSRILDTRVEYESSRYSYTSMLEESYNCTG